MGSTARACCPLSRRWQENIRLLLAIQPHGPYLLGGYCNGGHVAYEMARQMKQRGLEVDMLILLDAAVPRYFGWLKALVQGTGGVTRWNVDRQMQVYARLRSHLVRMLAAHGRGHREFLNFYWETARKKALRLAGTPLADVGIPASGFDDPLYTQHYWQLLHILMNYRPQPYQGRMVLLRTRSPQDSRAKDRTAGWGKLVPQLEVCEMPGNHGTFLTEHAEILADHLKRLLGECHEAAQSPVVSA